MACDLLSKHWLESEIIALIIVGKEFQAFICKRSVMALC